MSAGTLEAAGLAAEAVTFGAPVVLVAPVVCNWLRRVRVGSHGTPLSMGSARDSAAADAGTGAPLLTVPTGHADEKAESVPTRRRVDDHTVGEAAGAARRNPLAPADVPPPVAATM